MCVAGLCGEAHTSEISLALLGPSGLGLVSLSLDMRNVRYNGRPQMAVLLTMSCVTDSIGSAQARLSQGRQKDCYLNSAFLGDLVKQASVCQESLISLMLPSQPTNSGEGEHLVPDELK